MSEPIEINMRNRIINEATRLLVREGFDGIAMREIAEACGISKAGLYYHFADKETLFLAILNQSLDLLAEIISTAARHAGSARQRLGLFADAIFNQLDADQRALIRLAGQEMSKLNPTSRDAFARRYHTEFIGGLAQIIAEGMSRGDLRSADPLTTTWVLLGMMVPFFSAGSAPRTAASNSVVEFVLDIFFHGMQPET